MFLEDPLVRAFVVGLVVAVVIQIVTRSKGWLETEVNKWALRVVVIALCGLSVVANDYIPDGQVTWELVATATAQAFASAELNYQWLIKFLRGMIPQIDRR